MNNEKNKSEEDKKLEELTKENALDTERTRKSGQPPGQRNNNVRMGESDGTLWWEGRT